MGKHINKRLGVKTEFRELSSKEWGRILALPFPPATRASICLLFLEGGVGLMDLLLMGYSTGSNFQQINQVFIKHGLPYRLRNYRISEEKAWVIYRREAKFPPREFERSNQWFRRIETRLCTVTAYKIPI